MIVGEELGNALGEAEWGGWPGGRVSAGCSMLTALSDASERGNRKKNRKTFKKIMSAGFNM